MTQTISVVHPTICGTEWRDTIMQTDNTRSDALIHAVNASNRGESGREIVDRAQAFLNFLNGTENPPTQQSRPPSLSDFEMPPRRTPLDGI